MNTDSEPKPGGFPATLHPCQDIGAGIEISIGVTDGETAPGAAAISEEPTAEGAQS